MHDGDTLARRLFPALATSSEHEAWRPVRDADEEIFLLYTLYAPKTDRQGLGQVDSRNDVLRLSLNLHERDNGFEVCPISNHHVEEASMAKAKGRGISSHGRNKNTGRGGASQTLQVCIRQSSTSLRTDRGDTGSIVWRSSLAFAEKIIRDAEIASRGQRHHSREAGPCFLIAPQELVQCRVLELGSGTGVLPLLLSAHSFFEGASGDFAWLATDQIDMLPLLRKNVGVAHTKHVRIAELDWTEASSAYRSSSSSSRQSYLSRLYDSFGQSDRPDRSSGADLIVATDCIFNPSLFRAFVDTLNLCSSPHQTVAIVVCELRDSEMMTEFLDTWLMKGTRGEQWSIHAMSGSDIVGRLSVGSVAWVAWRES